MQGPTKCPFIVTNTKLYSALLHLHTEPDTVPSMYANVQEKWEKKNDTWLSQCVMAPVTSVIELI